MKTKLEFTIKQLGCLFTQGINEGEYRASSYDWGCTHETKWQNAFADAIDVLVHHGTKLDDPNRVSWGHIKEWVKEL